MNYYYDPEACVDDGDDDDETYAKPLEEDITPVYIFVSIIVLTTFLYVVNENDDAKNLRDFCLSNF
jgi:hypothetical protein